MTKLDANKSVARRFVDVFSALDGKGLIELFYDDAMYETVRNPADTSKKEPSHIARDMETMRKLFPNGLVLEIVNMIAESDRVVCEVHGKNVISLTNQRYDNRYLFILTIEGNKIAAVRSFADTALIERVIVPAVKALETAEHAARGGYT